MGELVAYLQDESAAVNGICKPNGCIYAVRQECTAKYSDEVVTDFAGDGCFSAAIRAADTPSEVRVRLDQSRKALDERIREGVIPGTMTRDGFTPFPGVNPVITPSEHYNKLKIDPTETYRE